MVVHRARRVVHRPRRHAQIACRHVAEHRPLLVELVQPRQHPLLSVDPLVVEHVRIAAVEARRTVRAMVLHVHLVPRAGIGELLHETRNVRITPVEEIDLKTLDAHLREMGRHALLVTVHLVERHPVPEIDAPLLRVLDEMIHVDNGTRLPDVEPEPDFVAVPVQHHVFKPVLRREVDEALVSLRVARLAAVESVPPVPRHLPRPHPREVRALVLRGRKRPHDVRLAELLRRIRKDEHAPRERPRPLRLDEPSLVLQHLDSRALFPDALRRARELRLERRSRTRTEVPDRVVAHVGLRDGHVLPARLVRERQVEHHL